MNVVVFGAVLTNPLTFVTDISLALICATLVARVRAVSLGQPYRFSFWFFVLLGASTAIGGIAHLLNWYLGPGAHYLAWLINGLSVFVAEIGATSLVRRREVQRGLLVLAALRYLLFVYLVLTSGRFLWVGLHGAFGFIAVISTIHIVQSLRSRDRTYLVAPLASFIMLIPAATHALNVHLSPTIDRNVVSHLLLIPAFYLLARAFGREHPPMDYSFTPPAERPPTSRF